ncbi:AbrB/MazE/SpoVT family DNA-binding domain-containing protein [Thiobaca trueperi]|nr:AbrB/MazE/SpoVT family DNA-binding domain-containing protein [Thiobaca trueperi]
MIPESRLGAKPPDAIFYGTLIDQQYARSQAMASVTLSSKFQLSIPKAIREDMHLQAGQKFAVIPKGDTIVLAPIRPLDEMRGILRGADTSDYRDRTDRLERDR